MAHRGIVFNEQSATQGVHDMSEQHQPVQIDKMAMWAWTILGVIALLFLLGLVIVSFWGGPFESDSYWRQTEAPAFPG